MTKPKILFTAFEATPFIKTGGLGDVAGSLPRALNQKSDCRLILPKLSIIPQEYRDQMRHLCEFTVPLSWRNAYCGLEVLELDGLTCYFLDNEYYFKRDRAYGYFDDGERMAFFSKAVLESLQHIPDFFPDVLHCNDWHTSLCPAFLTVHYRHLPGYDRLRTVFTIHNLKYQGIFSGAMLSDVLGLDYTAAHGPLSYGLGAINFMKSALYLADTLTTVSHTYAQEICTPEFGEHQDYLFRERSRDLHGILNGIDRVSYDPAKDPALAANYTPATVRKKLVNKRSLQQELGFAVRDEVPLLVFVGRITGQKGPDILLAAMDRLLQRDVQVAVLGTGEPHFENSFRYWAHAAPDRFKLVLRFDEQLSRRMYAGGDLLLMPSNFEPCGLSQMIAMRYGTLPLVRATGGLRDSVTPETGFLFEGYAAESFLDAVDRALAKYPTPDWGATQKAAMAQDFSWNASAAQYLALYQSLMER